MKFFQLSFTLTQLSRARELRFTFGKMAAIFQVTTRTAHPGWRGTQVQSRQRSQSRAALLEHQPPCRLQGPVGVRPQEGVLLSHCVRRQPHQS